MDFVVIGLREGGVAFPSLPLPLIKAERRLIMGKLVSYLMMGRRHQGETARSATGKRSFSKLLQAFPDASIPGGYTEISDHLLTV